VLNITPLRDAEYLISSVALGIDEYYLGVGEAPGVWQGRWAAELGLEGVVEADELRALVAGVHPPTGVDLLEGNRKRETFAFDATYSCPKSVSLLWAFGTPETATVVSRAHTVLVLRHKGQPVIAARRGSLRTTCRVASPDWRAFYATSTRPSLSCLAPPPKYSTSAWIEEPTGGKSSRPTGRCAPSANAVISTKAGRSGKAGTQTKKPNGR
jgi:hypothetical protein